MGKSKDSVDEEREVQIKLYLWRDGSLNSPSSRGGLLLGFSKLFSSINKPPSFRNEKEMEKSLSFSQKFHNMILYSNIIFAT
jgi:hypothetical protein